MSEPGADRYIGASQVDVTLQGAPYRAMVHLGVIAGRVVCVGLDLQAFDEERIGSGAVEVTPLPDWQPLTARRLRSIRLDEVVDQARQAARAIREDAMDYPGLRLAKDELDRFMAEVAEEIDLLEAPARQKSAGRPATLSEQDLVEVVAKTYRQHVADDGRAPVVAVRDALERAKAIPGAGPAPKNEVTVEQARAAVRRARKLGLLPRRENRGDDS